MGNRAVIAFGKTKHSIGIYLHWNGGRDSVEAFLKVAKDYRLAGDSQYAPARLCQIIGNFFGGTTSVGLDTVDHLDCDNGDNGVYYVDDKLDIVGRKFLRGGEQTGHPLDELVAAIKEKNDAYFIGKD